jgi:hypothetical protein
MHRGIEIAETARLLAEFHMIVPRHSANTQRSAIRSFFPFRARKLFPIEAIHEFFQNAAIPFCGFVVYV